MTSEGRPTRYYFCEVEVAAGEAARPEVIVHDGFKAFGVDFDDPPEGSPGRTRLAVEDVTGEGLNALPGIKFVLRVKNIGAEPLRVRAFIYDAQDPVAASVRLRDNLYDAEEKKTARGLRAEAKVPRFDESEIERDIAATRARNIADYHVLSLIDDHTGRESLDVVGLLVRPGSMPRVVSLGPVGRIPRGPFSLNEVACTEGCLDGNPHRPHLTRTSVATITEEQHRVLLERGILRFEPYGSRVEAVLRAEGSLS